MKNGFVCLSIAVALLTGCGKPAEVRRTHQALCSRRIVGGEIESGASGVGKFTVKLTGTKHACSATLLTNNTEGDNVALTAAHCLYSDESYLVQFPLGGGNEISRRVTRIVAHAGFDFDTRANDIGLVFFDGTVPDGFEKVRLAESRDALDAGSSVLLAGYGRTTINRNDSGVLRSVWTELEEIGNSANTFYSDHELRGVCLGDSGGGALVKTANGWVQMGVISAVDNDCLHLSVSVDVSSQLGWIAEHGVSVTTAPLSELACSQ